jgi:hypothetical protein
MRVKARDIKRSSYLSTDKHTRKTNVYHREEPMKAILYVAFAKNPFCNRTISKLNSHRTYLVALSSIISISSHISVVGLSSIIRRMYGRVKNKYPSRDLNHISSAIRADALVNLTGRDTVTGRIASTCIITDANN